MNLEYQELFMQRCFDLAEKGFRHSGFNPCVGSVLVHKNRIIGEGYYQRFGGSHAEVYCIDSVKESDKYLISQSTLFVSLEPCSIHGKTPPCSNLIIKHKIPNVVISVIDPNPKINGGGIQQLKEAGVEITTGILKELGEQIISKFKTNIVKKRPYISMKWAQSSDNYSGKKDQSIWITNEYSRILAHKLRHLNEAILVGPNTVNLDNPSLDNRHYKIDESTEQPVKLVIDRNEKIIKKSKLFHEGQNCIIFTSINEYKNPNPNQVSIEYISDWSWNSVFKRIFDLDISSVLIEGGPTIQKTMIKEDLWDEAHVLSSNHVLGEGIRAPRVTGHALNRLSLGSDSYVRILNK